MKNRVRIGIIVTVVQLLIFNSTYLQQLIVDSLVNYSYKLQGLNLKNKQHINAGTGFIYSHAGIDFLVSNYHVFTGKDAATNLKMEGLKDTPTAIIIWFRSDTGNKFKKLVMNLYDTGGNRLFSIYHGDSARLLDVAILPIYFGDYPPGIKKYILYSPNINLDTNFEAGRRVYVVGFPLGKMIDGWKPTVIQDNSEEFVEKPFISSNLSYDVGTIGGMSGSPVFRKEVNTKISLVGINYQNPDYSKDNPKIKGAALQLKYAIELISEMIQQNKSDVDLYRH